MQVPVKNSNQNIELNIDVIIIVMFKWKKALWILIWFLQPKSAATLCRPSPYECDLPEFCDGVTEYCPTDVFIMNGVTCQGGQVRS